MVSRSSESAYIISCDTVATEFIDKLDDKIKTIFTQNQMLSFTSYNLSSDVKLTWSICRAHMSSLLILLCGETTQSKGIIGT